MVLVDENRLKGNFGAHLVAQILSQRCLVRPVAEGTDIGVDLYCESVTPKGVPFQHFWVQVKTGAQVNVAEGSKRASCRFQRKNLEYWNRQPVPVFALLVPLAALPAQAPTDIYVVDITGYLLINGSPLEEEVTIASREDIQTIKPGEIQSLEWFLYHHVPFFTAARKIHDGVIGLVESPLGDSYVKYLATGPMYRFAPWVIETIRRTAAWGALDLMKFNDPAHTAYRDLLISILRTFEDSGHKYYENCVALGKAALLRGDFVEARKFKEQALARVAGDAKLNEADRTPMRRTIEEHLPEAVFGQSGI